MKITTPIAIVLDTTPLGLLTQKKGITEAEICRAWQASLETYSCRFYVPEIADYELHREFLRQGNTAAIERLDQFIQAENDRYLSLTKPDVRLASALWARVRNQGRMTAPPDALDADALIAAQANLLTPAAFGLSAMVVATANVGHLSVLTNAVFWSDMTS